MIFLNDFKLFYLSRECRGAQISSEHVQLEIVEDNRLAGVQFTQLFHIGQLLCTGHNDNVHIGALHGLNCATTSSTKKIQKQLIGLEDTLIVFIRFPQTRYPDIRCRRVGSQILHGNLSFGLIR